MKLKYNLSVSPDEIIKRLHVLLNQIYKLLPCREQEGDWVKPLQTIVQELCGFSLMCQEGASNSLLVLILKLQGLLTLTSQSEFQQYRRTIFECLSLMNKVIDDAKQLR